MQILDKVRQTEFLGRDFLVWLWFRSELQIGQFDLGEAGKVEIWFDNRMTLKSEGEEAAETLTCTGENSEMREARFALTEGKKITQARIKLIMGDDEWSFMLDSTWMNFKSLKTPRVVQDRSEDPDGIFYEKMFLIERPVAVVDALFGDFIRLRLAPEWETEELPALIQWIHEGK
jgi:recombination associated protein RdgC